MTRIGVISDTHGLLRPEAAAALSGVDLIIHAGDVGQPEVLVALQALAPVRAVRGNVDSGPWAAGLPEAEVVATPGGLFYVLHDLRRLDLDPRAAGFAGVISGHSHRSAVEQRQGVLFLNPGSAGPRRFHLPVSVARLSDQTGSWQAEIVRVDV